MICMPCMPIHVDCNAYPNCVKHFWHMTYMTDLINFNVFNILILFLGAGPGYIRIVLMQEMNNHKYHNMV